MNPRVGGKRQTNPPTNATMPGKRRPSRPRHGGGTGWRQPSAAAPSARFRTRPPAVSTLRLRQAGSSVVRAADSQSGKAADGRRMARVSAVKCCYQGELSRSCTFTPSRWWRAAGLRDQSACSRPELARHVHHVEHDSEPNTLTSRYCGSPPSNSTCFPVRESGRVDRPVVRAAPCPGGRPPGRVSATMYGPSLMSKRRSGNACQVNWRNWRTSA